MTSRPYFCAHADTWFHIRELADRIHLISEPGHVNSYLVVGDTSAALFDSGMGIAPISDVVRQLTSLPVLVIASHHHIDHRGGHADLATSGIALAGFGAHPAAFAPDSHCAHVDADPSFLEQYASAFRTVIGDYAQYRALDDHHFFVLPRLGRMRALPDLTAWRVPAVQPTLPLADGELIDLGGRRLRVLHTAGHAPDVLCLFEEDTGILFSGDTVLGAAHWLHGDDADVEQFARSTARLAELNVSRVLAAHNLTSDIPAAAVGEVAAAARALLAGNTSSQPSTDLLGRSVCRHDHGPVTLLTSSS
ncbi:MBL fold metallo-hydrolase [Rhodococcus sp. WS4]|nr:MBL fold metallo-hydrolase [Rhodococcus sp. WS4]